MESADFEIELELECITSTGRSLFLTIEKTIECGGKWEYEQGCRVYFDYNESEMDSKCEQKMEEFLSDQPEACLTCEEYLDYDLYCDETITEVKQAVNRQVIYNILREDNSFDYCDRGHTTCSDINYHGFEITFRGSQVIMNSLKFFGIFEDYKARVAKNPKKLYNLIEELKNYTNEDNFEMIADMEELEKLQEVLRRM